MPLSKEHYESVAPAETESTNTYVALGPITVGSLRSVSITIKVATDSIDWTVFGANQSDFSDEVEVQAEAAVGAGSNASYSVAQAPYLNYRAKIKSTVTDNPGDVTLVAVAKG